MSSYSKFEQNTILPIVKYFYFEQKINKFHHNNINKITYNYKKIIFDNNQ